ncbi:GATA transcription factor 27 isoform X2 [Canna indica]|uniref:GATA transcription factor 27 isoform X2 n=1 Tax=Canna indica TaxID=4628 RepID=A0AAQ3KF10_9LILI|nr:GATA transcription factor 27 isoform X2 [Canna indica]
MGKTGPCRHCGVTSTPLWRNGPPDKPVLCNACGSRWRTKGSLTNYTPLHVREAFDSEQTKASSVKGISFKPKDQRLQKNKKNYCDQNFQKIVERDTSHRSSYRSAISHSDSYAHGSIDADTMTGSAQSNVQDQSLVPSNKRTFLNCRKPSSVEKLTKDLYSILHQQQSYLSGSSEEDLLYESESSHGYTEIGYGGVLIRHPNYKLIEESEASSLAEDNRSCITNEHNTWLASFPMHSESEGTQLSKTGIDKLKQLTRYMAQDNVTRHKIPHEKLKMSQGRDSSLLSADLNVEGRKGKAIGSDSPGIYNLTPKKGGLDCDHQDSSELKDTRQSPKRLCKTEASDLPWSCAPQLKSTSAGLKFEDKNIFVENEGDNFRNKSSLASHADKCSMSALSQFTADSSDSDLLPDVPPNASFAEAELLHHTLEEKSMSNVCSAVILVAETDESLSSFPSRFRNEQNVSVTYIE